MLVPLFLSEVLVSSFVSIIANFCGAIIILSGDIVGWTFYELFSKQERNPVHHIKAITPRITKNQNINIP
jgi:hypothetical protein